MRMRKNMKYRVTGISQVLSCLRYLNMILLLMKMFDDVYLLDIVIFWVK